MNSNNNNNQLLQQFDMSHVNVSKLEKKKIVTNINKREINLIWTLIDINGMSIHLGLFYA